MIARNERAVNIHFCKGILYCLVDCGTGARALSGVLSRRLPRFARRPDYLIMALPVQQPWEEDGI
jgi:hypothetical protein